MNRFYFTKFFLYTALSATALPSFVYANYFTLPVDVDPQTDITSLFDHDYPDYSQTGVMIRSDGSVFTDTDATIDGCTNGEGCYDGHNGVDFSVPIDTDVFSARDGEVADVYWNNCGGMTMRVWHNDIGLSTLYSHIATTTISTTTDIVKRYDHIAESNSTGECSTDPHLHFGVSDGNSQSSHRIDPFGWTGSGSDPWVYNQGYLWATNPPAFPSIFSESWAGFTGTITGHAPWVANLNQSSMSVSGAQGVGGSNSLYTGSYSSPKGNRVATSTNAIYIPGTDFDLSYYIRPDNLSGTPNNDAGSIVVGLGNGINAIDINMTFFRPFGTPGRVAACGRNMNATSTGLGCFYAPSGTSWAGVPHRVRVTREGHTTCFRMWPVSDPMPSSCQLTRYEVNPSTLTQLRIEQVTNRWRNTAVDDIILYTLP
jgi:hypothetical protein